MVLVVWNCAADCVRRRSHIFGSEEPNLIAGRTKSYCPKIWFLLRVDIGVLPAGVGCRL